MNLCGSTDYLAIIHPVFSVDCYNTGSFASTRHGAGLKFYRFTMYTQISVIFNGGELARYCLAEDEILIGRSSESEVHLDNPGVSRTHAKILRLGNTLEIIDLHSGNGTFVNGKKTDRTTLTGDDTVEIGKFRLNVSLVEHPTRADISAPTPRETPEVIHSTVFLKPDESKKILLQAQNIKQPKIPVRASTKPSNPPPPDNSALAWAFSGGLILGFCVAWLIWG
jgi:predicted component of type VI protein secretion system